MKTGKSYYSCPFAIVYDVWRLVHTCTSVHHEHQSNDARHEADVLQRRRPPTGHTTAMTCVPATRSEIGHNLKSKRTAVYRNNIHKFGGAFTAVATAPSISVRSFSDGFLVLQYAMINHCIRKTVPGIYGATILKCIHIYRRPKFQIFRTIIFRITIKIHFLGCKFHSFPANVCNWLEEYGKISLLIWYNTLKYQCQIFKRFTQKGLYLYCFIALLTYCKWTKQ